MLKFDPTCQKTGNVKNGRHMKGMTCIKVFVVWHDYARIRHMYVCMCDGMMEMMCEKQWFNVCIPHGASATWQWDRWTGSPSLSTIPVLWHVYGE